MMNRIERVCQTCGAMTDEYVTAYSKLDDEIVTCRDCARAVYRAYRGVLEAELGRSGASLLGYVPLEKLQ